MFLQTSTPDTSGYMIAGFIIAFAVMGFYVASIYLRNRNLNQDRATLEEMEPEPGKQPTPQRAKTVTKKSN